MTTFRFETQDDSGEPPFPERDVGSILKEALEIYLGRWSNFLLASALLNVPMVLLELVTDVHWSIWALWAILALLTYATLFPTFVSIVCQHYLYGVVDVGAAFRRAQWRLISVLGILVLEIAVLAAGTVTIFIIVPFIAAVVFLIYWSVAVPASVVEGHKTVDALRRSYHLVRGNWWRTFLAFVVFTAVLAVAFLVTFGIQWLFTEGLLEGGSATAAGLVIQIVSTVAIAPLIPICTALLYLDLRTRQEHLDVPRLRKDLEFGTAEGGHDFTGAATP